jgi:galactokinase
MSIQQKVTSEFETRYGHAPAFVVRAPGRVNLIGEHTDYNDGFVLPMAINRAVWIALSPRDDGKVVADALDFEKQAEFVLMTVRRGEDPGDPAEYIKGVAWALREAGYDLRGWEGVIKGDVPVGAGLSSSAALEMAVMQAFAAVSGFDFAPKQMAQLGQQVENDWIGVNSGIMDQMISAAGKQDSALLIDCRTLETEALPLPRGTVVAVLDTGTRRGLVTSAYNDRRKSCEKAARILGVDALRDVSVTDFEMRDFMLDDVTRKRARHVVTENARVLVARDALKRGDPVDFGLLMNLSHDSMRDDFEISSEALNAIVECAQQQDGCYGARMTGGGFAGCAVALVRVGAAAAFTDQVAACYTDRTEHEPQIYITPAVQGTGIVSGA